MGGISPGSGYLHHLSIVVLHLTKHYMRSDLLGAFPDAWGRIHPDTENSVGSAYGPLRFRTGPLSHPCIHMASAGCSHMVSRVSLE